MITGHKEMKEEVYKLSFNELYKFIDDYTNHFGTFNSSHYYDMWWDDVETEEWIEQWLIENGKGATHA